MASKLRLQLELKPIGYELFIGALSILSLVNLAAMFILQSYQSLQTVLYIINVVMMPIFLGDFFYRFFTASSKSGYFWRSFGWADLLSSLPLPQIKLLRIFRLWRVIRLLIEFGARNLLREFVAHRAENALFTVFFLVLCVLEFGSLAVLTAESASPNANIVNAADALWWVYVTITTVGYGDYYPVTLNGRLVGIIVMTAGVGLFGTLSGFLAQKFLAPAKQAAPAPASAQPAPTDAQALATELRSAIAAQEQATALLKRRLAEIEQQF